MSGTGRVPDGRGMLGFPGGYGMHVDSESAAGQSEWHGEAFHFRDSQAGRLARSRATTRAAPTFT